MPKWLRALIAGYGAKKLGGGCFTTILIFVVIYYALGKCNQSSAPVRQGTLQTSQPVKTAMLEVGK
jgi:hypothetical protein